MPEEDRRIFQTLYLISAGMVFGFVFGAPIVSVIGLIGFIGTSIWEGKEDARALSLAEAMARDREREKQEAKLWTVSLPDGQTRVATPEERAEMKRAGRAQDARREARRASWQARAKKP